MQCLKCSSEAIPGKALCGTCLKGESQRETRGVRERFDIPDVRYDEDPPFKPAIFAKYLLFIVFLMNALLRFAFFAIETVQNPRGLRNDKALAAAGLVVGCILFVVITTRSIFRFLREVKKFQFLYLSLLLSAVHLVNAGLYPLLWNLTPLNWACDAIIVTVLGLGAWVFLRVIGG